MYVSQEEDNQVISATRCENSNFHTSLGNKEFDNFFGMKMDKVMKLDIKLYLIVGPVQQFSSGLRFVNWCNKSQKSMMSSDFSSASWSPRPLVLMSHTFIFFSLFLRRSSWCGQDAGWGGEEGGGPRRSPEGGGATGGSEAAGGREEGQICQDGGWEGKHEARHQR